MFLELSEKSAERLFRPAKRTIKLKCKKGSDCFFFFLQGDICFTKAKYLCCAFGLFQLQSADDDYVGDDKSKYFNIII